MPGDIVLTRKRGYERVIVQVVIFRHSLEESLPLSAGFSHSILDNFTVDSQGRCLSCQAQLIPVHDLI